MRNYILVTESGLDACLMNNAFSDGFRPKLGGVIHEAEIAPGIICYYTANEPENPYFALINSACLEQLMETECRAEDAYRRIARVVKGLKAPPVHLPRQWSEYHHKNLLAFFALPRGASNRRWIVDLDGGANGARFNVFAATGAEMDLSRHVPLSWPEGIFSALQELVARKTADFPIETSSSLAAEIDLKAIGSASITGNRTFEQWLGSLTQSQREALNHPIDTSIRIVGPAGSGKTLALCMRAIQISRDLDVQKMGKKVLIATHSWAMAERIDGVIGVLNGGVFPDGVTVFPLLSLLDMHAGHIGSQRTEVIGDDSTDGRIKSMEIIGSLLKGEGDKDRIGLSEWIVDGLRASDESRSRLDLIMNLYDEISGVLTASGVAPDDPDSIRHYINSRREDWMPPFFTEADRGFVIGVYREFIQELIDRSAITTDQFVLDSIRVLETFTWRMRKETDGYDYILVDELQLFDPQERSALELLGRSKKGVPFVTAEDPSQGVFSALNARPGMAQDELVYLETVHRFNREIFELISYIYQKFPLNTLPLRVEPSKDPVVKRPCLYTCAGDASAIDFVAKLAESINSEAAPSDRICLATLGDIDDELVRKLEGRRLPITRLSGLDDVEQLTYSKRSIVVAPWQFVGGTQFSHVIVVAAAISAPQSQFGKLRELISVYLACSRAAQSLHVVCSTYTPSVIWEAKESGLLVHENVVT